MTRNTESRFAYNPTNIDMSRSSFDRSSSVKTSFNVGQIVPFYVDEVLPGDTFNVKTSKVVRLQTLLTPIMDNIYLDTYYFFVPNRLVWDHWKEFMGENTSSAWIPEVEYQIPQIEAPDDGWEVGTIADYFGVPVNVDGISVNALPFRAYALIMNEWFRDQNLSDPINIPTGDATVQGTNGDDPVIDVAFGGKPYIAAKYRDYFTSCLPSPQKGPDVLIPVAEAANYPVVPLEAKVPSELLEGKSYTSNLVGGSDKPHPIAFNGETGVQRGGYIDSYLRGTSYKPLIDNLWAVADGNAASATINQLRLAFQIQKLYEKDARGGTRYIEMIKAHFGVTNPDYRLQRPEYLGGNRIPITINQVLQTSATMDGTTPQGNPSGQSLTTDVNSDFVKSFTEHGYIIGVVVARYDHTYQDGINRLWNRKDRFDYYFPVLANIGEQPVLNKEIYAQGDSVVDENGEVVDEQVFGYQEAWAEYRYKPSIVTGEMRSKYAQSLDVWHLADDYDDLPALSDAWIREDAGNVDRVLAVASDVSNQLFADIFIRNRTTRPMPLYSIPGLIDHH